MSYCHRLTGTTFQSYASVEGYDITNTAIG
jgi:hypothetical protein